MNRTDPPPWWTELPLVAVHVIVAASFARVYEDGSYLLPLLAFVLGAHALAIGCRRARLPVWLTVAVALAGAVLVATWALFPHTATWGLPTAATWRAATAAFDEAQAQYPVVVAPAPVLVGFQLAAGLALWLAAWFADWTGHRMQASGEAVAPAGAIFVFCAILGSGNHQLLSAGAFGASVLVFLAVQRLALVDPELVGGSVPVARPARARLLASGAVLTALAVLGGVVVGPRLPGASSEAAIDWRNGSDGDSSRVTVSPMVELKKRLVDQSDQLLFEVRASQRAYWRLTSLDAFDGQIWSSSGEYRPADDDLPSEVSGGLAADTITQSVRIDALAAIWVPTAFEAVSVRESDAPLRWDPDSSTLIVESSKETSDGLSYRVVSRAPNLTPATLQQAGTVDPPAITARYEGLPAGFPAMASTLARRVTTGAADRYQQAIALQDYFRDNFDYSLNSPAGHGDDALVAFLESGVGYCEQFAGAYAAMARSLGIPARVAVGFTPGNPDPEDPTLYRVLGRHAHAWPEVYFPKVGWVPFEPTPGRGMPSAERYTKVREQQDQGQPITITTTTEPSQTTAATTAPGEEPTRPQTSRPNDVKTSGSDPATSSGPDRGGSSAGPVVLLALALAAAAGGWMVLRRRRQALRLGALSAADRSWEQVCARLAHAHGVRAEPAETPLELADRAAPELGDALAGQLRELAELVTESRWSPTALSDEPQARITELAATITAALDHPEPART